MTRQEDNIFDNCPDHPAFAPEEWIDGTVYETWRTLLQCPGGEDTGHFARFSGYGDPYILDFRVDVHDDAIGHYWTFVEWLATVSSSRGFVGYSLLQDGGYSDPELIYFIDGKLRYHLLPAVQSGQGDGVS